MAQHPWREPPLLPLPVRFDFLRLFTRNLESVSRWGILKLSCSFPCLLLVLANAEFSFQLVFTLLRLLHVFVPARDTQWGQGSSSERYVGGRGGAKSTLLECLQVALVAPHLCGPGAAYSDAT